ncbi:hypothetical protein CBL_12433 [Carabus blaptoides fortunei]
MCESMIVINSSSRKSRVIEDWLTALDMRQMQPPRDCNVDTAVLNVCQNGHSESILRPSVTLWLHSTIIVHVRMCVSARARLQGPKSNPDEATELVRYGPTGNSSNNILDDAQHQYCNINVPNVSEGVDNPPSHGSRATRSGLTFAIWQLI